MPQLLETVVALQQDLEQLDDLERRLEGVPPEMQDLHDEYNARKAEIEVLQGEIEEAKAERRRAEAGVEDCASRLEHFQEQVSRVRTQREYAAILQEIDTVREQSRSLEDEALAAMERQEEAESRLAEKRVGFDDLEEEYEDEMEKWEAAKPEVRRRAETLRERIEARREEIPPSALRLFERIRDATGGDPLAPVREVDRGPRSPSIWHCGTCNYNVRPQVVVEIRSNKSLVQCDSCKRLLYFEDEAPAA